MSGMVSVLAFAFPLHTAEMCFQVMTLASFLTGKIGDR